MSISVKDMEDFNSIDDLELNTAYLFYGVDERGNNFFSTGFKDKKEKYDSCCGSEPSKKKEDDTPKYRIRFDMEDWNYSLKPTKYIKLED